jgi:hypothetical protein
MDHEAEVTNPKRYATTRSVLCLPELACFPATLDLTGMEMMDSFTL